MKYDLICSLGGNCSVAHNLKYRNLRLYSLPFDWVYMEDDIPLRYLSDGFKNHFCDLGLRENLNRIPGNDSHKIIFKDRRSGYCFPNHFLLGPENVHEYNVFHSNLRKRIDRLEHKLAKAECVLFILAVPFEFDVNFICKLRDTLNSIYPGKYIEFCIVQFNCRDEDEDISQDNILLKRYTRDMNKYDFTMTNWEWSFLDNLDVKQVSRWPIKIFSCTHFGYSFKIFLEKQGT